jgi:tetratricopeptide (TPR) repeat protein
MLISLLNLGILYQNMCLYDKESETYHLALKIAEEIDDQRNIAICLNMIGINLIRKKDYQKALSYFDESIQLAKSIESMPEIAMNYEQMCIANYLNGNKVQALTYYNDYKTIYDSIRSLDSTFVLPNKIASPKHNKKLENEKNNIFSLIYIPFILGLIILIIKSYRKKQ